MTAIVNKTSISFHLNQCVSTARDPRSCRRPCERRRLGKEWGGLEKEQKSGKRMQRVNFDSGGKRKIDHISFVKKIAIGPEVSLPSYSWIAHSGKTQSYYPLITAPQACYCHTPSHSVAGSCSVSYGDAARDHYAIRSLISIASCAIKTNNRENDITLLKWPKD